MVQAAIWFQDTILEDRYKAHTTRFQLVLALQLHSPLRDALPVQHRTVQRATCCAGCASGRRTGRSQRRSDERG